MMRPPCDGFIRQYRNHDKMKNKTMARAPRAGGKGNRWGRTEALESGPCRFFRVIRTNAEWLRTVIEKMFKAARGCKARAGRAGTVVIGTPGVRVIEAGPYSGGVSWCGASPGPQGRRWCSRCGPAGKQEVVQWLIL